MTAPTQPLTQASIRQLLLTNDKAVVRACMALYQRQLSDEQACGQTRHKNGIGFSNADASPLSHIAKMAEHFDVSSAWLTAAKLADARKRVLKYTGQLLQIAQQKQLDKML
jgi:hypothetical protein